MKRWTRTSWRSMTGCQEATQVREAGLEYVFSRDGLIVEPMLPHVIAACVKQLVITYAKLKLFAE